MAAFVFYPAAICLTDEWDNVQLNQVDGSGTLDGRHNLNNEALYEVREGFIGDVWAATKYCGLAYPIGSRPIWAQLTALIGLVGYFVFTIIGRIEYKRQVRRTSAQQRTARHNVVKQRTAQTTGGSPLVTVRERSGGVTAQPRRATTSARGLDRVSSGPWDPLDAGGDDVLDRLDRAIVERDSASRQNEKVAPEPSDDFDALDSQLPSLDQWDNDVADTIIAPSRAVSAGTALAESLDEAVITGAVAGACRVGTPFTFLMHGVNRQKLPSSVRVSLHLLRDDGSTERCFVDRLLLDVATVEGHDEGVLARVAWRHMAIAVLDHTRNTNGAVGGVRLELTQQGKVWTSEAPLLDVLRLDVKDQFGAEAVGKRLIAIDADGRLHTLETDANGRRVVHDVPPGRIQVTSVDRSLIQLPAGNTVTSLDLTTTGVTFATPTEAVGEDAAHSLTLWRYNRWWVVPGAEGGDGTERRPFGSVADAMQRIVERRGAGDDATAYDEVRIGGATTSPKRRLGASGSAWADWWGGRPVSTANAWTSPVTNAEITGQHQENEAALREDIDIVGLERLRVISETYGAFFDGLNASDAPITESIDRQLAALSLTTLCRPVADMANPFRVDIRNCKQITLMGLHLVGGRGQSGLHLQDSHHVYVARLWIEGFQSGLTNQESTIAVGRGLQIDRSGRGPDDARVRIERCDIGTNRAQRRSMPIRGGGIAIYESVVELDGCYVHHNLASQDPAAITADKHSTLSGASNHREANEVLPV